MIPQNLPEMLEASAKRYPRRIAIVFGQKKISYRTIDEESSAIAAGLRGLGVQQQEKVALFLDNCPEFVIAYFGVLKAGCIVVPVNYMFKTEELKFILQDSEAAVLIISRVYAEMGRELRMRLDSLRHVVIAPGFHELRKARRRDLASNSEPASPSDPAVILYTSGTTGFPKGAVLSHYNLVSNAIDSSKAINVNRRDAFICILPLFHSFAATVCMNTPLLVGAKIVLMKSLRPFRRVIRAVLRNRVTIFVAIPSIYNILKEIKLPRIVDNALLRLFNPVKVCVSGAAALPVETLRKFQRRFRVPLLEGYGLTEAAPVVTLNPLRGRRKPGSIGLPLAKHIEVKVVDAKGHTLDRGEIGELAVRGPNVMLGYYRQKEATAEALRDGWLYTGDMARIDRNGYIYIVGRKKEMVNVRGLNVYPREIEETLYQNLKIKEAAVIGVPDPHKGEVPKGFVVLKEGEEATEQELIQFLRERLASYKVPKHIEFRDSLPKNATGKILKRLLEESGHTKHA